MQHIVQLIGIAHVRPGLFPHLGNRRRIEASHFFEHRFRQHAPHLHRTRPALFERCVIEKRIRIRIQNLVRKLRRNRCVDRETTDPSIRQSAQDKLQPVNIHGLGEDILHHFTDQRMIRNMPVAHNIFLARSRVGKNGSQQIIGPHALNLRRNLLSILKAQQRQRPVRIPAPARGEDRRIQSRLFENRLHRLSPQKVEDVRQREAVLLGQGNVQPVVGSCSLQLEVEPNAEAFAQSQSPRLVDASSEGRVDHQLHATAFIEEALRNHGCLGRHRAQHGPPLQDVFNRLLRAGIIEATFLLEPTHCFCNFRLRGRETHRRSVRQHFADLFP